MKIKHIKKLLTSEIRKVAQNVSEYCFHPKNDLVRNRKLPAEVLLKTVIGMESRSLTNELINLFYSSPDMPILTNLDALDYPPEKIKQLYASRWGIETSFCDLKYTVGMLNFHSKKVMCIQQEIHAHLIMYTFSPCNQDFLNYKGSSHCLINYSVVRAAAYFALYVNCFLKNIKKPPISFSDIEV